MLVKNPISLYKAKATIPANNPTPAARKDTSTMRKSTSVASGTPGTTSSGSNLPAPSDLGADSADTRGDAECPGEERVRNVNPLHTTKLHRYTMRTRTPTIIPCRQNAGAKYLPAGWAPAFPA